MTHIPIGVELHAESNCAPRLPKAKEDDGPHTSRSLFFFFELFSVQARNAISQLSETELMGRPILVREDRGDTGQHGRGVGGAAGAKVYVGNLSWQVQWQDLKDHMRTVSIIYE